MNHRPEPEHTEETASGLCRCRYSEESKIIRDVAKPSFVDARDLRFFFRFPFSLERNMSERYGFSLTTFSPSGKLVQIEYALNAVNAGSPAVGIKASNGVVLATEKKSKSLLHDDRSIHKVEPLCKSMGLVYSGMGPDYR